MDHTYAHGFGENELPELDAADQFLQEHDDTYLDSPDQVEPEDVEELDRDEDVSPEALKRAEHTLKSMGVDVDSDDIPLSAVTANGTPMTVYARMVQFGLLKKITDICMAKADVPYHLRKDAESEVHARWLAREADLNFGRGQTASYAYRSGLHAALATRRELGAVVKLPTTLWKTGRDSAFAQSIGAAINPKNIEDFADTAELSVSPTDLTLISPISEKFFHERVGPLGLMPRQQDVAHRFLVLRKPSAVIAAEMGLQVPDVEKLMAQVTSKLVRFDADPTGVRPGRPRKAAAPSANTQKRRMK